MKIAILIIGELRFNNNFDNLYNSIKNFDIFISTYDDYKDNAYKLTNKSNIILFKRKDLKLKTSTIYQWYHLHNMLNKFKNKLKNYNILVKIRSECYFYEPIDYKHFIDFDPKFFYMNSDHSFYAERKIFYKLLSDFYNHINLKYICNNNKFFEINYDNLIDSYNNIYNIKYQNKYIMSKYSQKNLNVRMDIDVGIKEQVYPKDIYENNIHFIISNLKRYKKNNVINNFIRFRNQDKSRNKIFASEKFFFLHIINQIKIRTYNLPSIGIVIK